VVIPLPAIGVSYNTGVTVGTIVPILSALPSGRITSILAPSITYNPYLGTQVGARYYRYYKGNLKRWHLIGLQSNSIWNFYEFHYRDLSMGDGRYILDIRLKDFKNPAARFYGLGPESSFGNQTNYTLSEASAHVTAGLNLDHQKIRAWIMERLREYGASPGVIPGMPYSGTVFPDVNGISNSPVIISHRVNLTYDTRDNHLIPSTGTYARAFAELDQNETAGEVSIFDRFNAEYKTWIPQGDNDQNVLAIRGMVNLMNGPNIPFYAQSMLGGAYTLEGFGTGRFYDLDAALFNMEERIQAFNMTLLGVTSSWQIAPFLGVGEVFHDQRELTNPSLYAINPGVGFRALVEPNVVGRLDMGYSTQAGVVEYVGIGFPF
jgi:outer membrane protein assembly factor BamA